MSPKVDAVQCSRRAFNISFFALLTHLIAHVTDLEVGEFVYMLVDYHVYKNHLEQVDPRRELRGLKGC